MQYPDIFFTPEYARLFEDTAFGGQIESRFIRQIPNSHYFDASMPYGYTAASEPVCEFARLHPFLEHNCDPKYVKQVGDVVYIDLIKSGHPTPRKLNHVKWIINWFGAGPVLDPFMGSGTTLQAAKECGFRSVGIEIEEKYCEMAVKRNKQQVLL